MGPGKRWTTGLLLLLVVLGHSAVGAHGTPRQQTAAAYAEAIIQANLRSGPGVEYPVVAEIVPGTQYAIVAQHALVPWLRIEYPAAVQAWVYLDVVNVTGNMGLVPSTSDFPPLQTATPTSASISTAVSTATSPLGSLSSTPEATSSVPTATATINGPLVITKGEANIRYGPGVEYPSIVEVPQGTSFRLLEFHALYPWLHVALTNAAQTTGWIYEELVDITGDTSQVPYTSQTNFTLPQLTATPQIVTVNGAPWDSARAPSGALASTVGEPIFEYLLEHRFAPYTDRLASVFVMDLKTGDTFSLYDKVAFSGMSLTKIPILVTYFQRHEGPLSPEDAFLVADTMMCSENITTNDLLGLIGEGDTLRGAQRVTALMQSLDLRGTFIMREYGTDPNAPPPTSGATLQTNADQVSAQPDAYNQVVPSDLGWLLAGIYQCAENETGLLMERYPNDFDAQECRRMLAAMDGNVINVFLEAGVPSGAKVIHKHGWIDEAHGDAGIVIGPESAYVMTVVMYEEDHLLFQEDSSPVIAELSRLVWNALNPNYAISAPTIGIVPGECDPLGGGVMTALTTTAPLPMLTADAIQPGTTVTVTPTATIQP